MARSWSSSRCRSSPCSGSRASRSTAGRRFAQQRDQQTASDLAALAGANDFLITNSELTAIERARTVAEANGYAHARGGTVVDVTVTANAGASIKVAITALHQNMMAGLLGMPTWTLSTTATALAGFPRRPTAFLRSSSR